MRLKHLAAVPLALGLAAAGLAGCRIYTGTSGNEPIPGTNGLFAAGSQFPGFNAPGGQGSQDNFPSQENTITPVINYMQVTPATISAKATDSVIVKAIARETQSFSYEYYQWTGPGTFVTPGHDATVWYPPVATGTYTIRVTVTDPVGGSAVGSMTFINDGATVSLSGTNHL